MTYTRSDAKPKADPRATAQRILDSLRVEPDERMFRCHFCRDTGWRELEPGARATMQCGATVTVEQCHAGYVERCRGPQNVECPYAAHRRRDAAEKAAQSGKPASGEGSAL